MAIELARSLKLPPPPPPELTENEVKMHERSGDIRDRIEEARKKD